MDPKQITALAKLLKDSGDKVLNCEYKLSLSGSLLRALNDAFSLIVDKNETLPPQSFQVVKPHNAKSDVFRDIQFIYDFVQKTIILSLNQFINDDPYEFEVDISKFRSLRKLEIQKIPISQITGIQQMRSQLTEIVCIRSISHVKDVITSCGGDNSNGFTWNELKAANFSYNMMHQIDSSLEFTPWLENLNLSHNQIVSVSAIKWLPNLRVLNLSYNKLTHIPSFHVDAMKKIQVFHISNNFIEDLSGISRLLCLSELDASGNCIVDHTALLPVSTLASLCFLNLKDNPLACHPKHRQATARYLNRNTSTAKFVLDDEPLSKYEKSLTGNYDSYHAILAPRHPGSVSSSGLNTPTRRSVMNTPTGSISSRSSFRMETNDEMSSSIISQKKIKVRRAIICEDDPTEASPQYDTKREVSAANSSLETSRDHLETKKKIESLRKQYGSEWLQSQAGSMVKNVIGFDPSVGKEFESVLHYEGERKNTKSESASSAPKTISVEISIASTKRDNTDENIKTSTPVDRDSSKLLESFESPIKSNVGRRSEGVASEADFKSVIADDDSSNYQSMSDVTTGNVSHSLILNDIYGNPVEEELESIEEENERSYIVHRMGHPNEIILVVSDASIREMEGDKTKTRWGISSLEACERPTSTSITLLFGTIKKDKKMRTYEMDEQSSQELESFLRGILSKRPLSEMNQKLFDCVVCKARFSREVTFSKVIDNLQCPECSQPFCVEITESPAKWNPTDQGKHDSDATVQPMETTSELAAAVPGPSGLGAVLKQSDSRTSIARPDAWKSPVKNKPRSTGSLNDSSSCSRISQPSSSCDSNRSVAGSTNSERDRDVDLIGNDSDIEVLSNPSQSSIEVLDRGFHPSRKHSEERKILQLSGLEVLQDDDSLNNISTTLINQETSTHDLIAKVADSFNKIIKIEDAPPTDKENSVTPKPSHSVLSHKKSFLTAANLTESSSSGSVTDSVCTAYESNQDPKQSSTSDKIVESDKSKKESKPGLDSPASKSENSVISTVLGGLFQSTNMLMSKTPKPSKPDPSSSLPFEPIKYSYADYSNVDHRLKLYLYQNLFEDTNETLKWLVSCVIFDENQLDKWPTGFDGLFIMSTTKFYVMKKTAAENDDPSSWLKKHLSGTIDRVGIAQVLPWKIGMKFVISAVGGIHIILQDILRTDCLILFFAENPLPEYCTFDYQPSELLTNKLSKATNGEMVKILMVINFCEVLSDDVLQNVQLCTLLLTDSQLFLAPDIKWLNENSKYQIESKYTQLMSNLIELEDIHSLSCRLNFIDEKEDKYETWRIDFATVTAKESAVSTICNSWQNIFGVPLINTSENSSSNNNNISIVSHTSQINDSKLITNISN
ncbi:serine/threonine-protein kinase 11-interacting protein isoform X1 [Aedes aegypti]|uniref:LKB1 serine/threonine kinase interacting protein 1 N-terminal domain-containing protein n=1 Tax=Aedes aegypti TaxID=7159 RepID=A0A6I8TEX3_AEDAE|nr:serine/threonine-protein kinase 11-interacting protein isoform X1 [Aedes aegypti]